MVKHLLKYASRNGLARKQASIQKVAGGQGRERELGSRERESKGREGREGRESEGRASYVERVERVERSVEGREGRPCVRRASQAQL